MPAEPSAHAVKDLPGTERGRHGDFHKRDWAWIQDKGVAAFVFVGGISAIIFILGIFVFITKEGLGFIFNTMDLKEFFLERIWPVIESGEKILSKFDEFKKTAKEQRDYTTFAVWLNEVQEDTVRLHEYKAGSFIHPDLLEEKIVDIFYP